MVHRVVRWSHAAVTYPCESVSRPSSNTWGQTAPHEQVSQRCTAHGQGDRGGTYLQQNVRHVAMCFLRLVEQHQLRARSHTPTCTVCQPPATRAERSHASTPNHHYPPGTGACEQPLTECHPPRSQCSREVHRSTATQSASPCTLWGTRRTHVAHAAYARQHRNVTFEVWS